MNQTYPIDNAEETQGLKPPFTREQLQADVGTVLITVARLTRWMFFRSDRNTSTPLLHLLGHPGEVGLQDALGVPEFDWESGEFRYDMVATTALAEDTDKLFDLAYLGHIDTDVADLCSESGPSWTSRILKDLHSSHFVAEWNEYSRCQESFWRCLQVYETAHARLVLEGIERDDLFMDWHGPALDGLTIRQLSLLSGMTEASLRTMASPKRRNPLRTQSDGKNTFVSTADAKEWLTAKRCYVPIKYTSRGGRVDLTRRRFNSADDLLQALDQRVRFLLSEPHDQETKQKLGAIAPGLLVHADRSYLHLDKAGLDDSDLMTRIGDALGLSGSLLALRAAEARALDRLRTVEREIHSLIP